MKDIQKSNMHKLVSFMAVLASTLSFTVSQANGEGVFETAAGHADAVQSSQAFADWLASCDSEHVCRMSQSIVQPTTDRLVLQVRVFPGDDPTLLLSFPLGILLSPGWRYRIDGRAEVVLPFEVCDLAGCHAGVKLTPDLLSAMKRGNRMQVTFFDAARQPVEPVLSLAGFTKAWDALQ